LAKVQGRRSKSEFNHAAYKQSWRAKRRETFALVREQVRAAKPPPLLGPHTDILTVLAASGPVRRVSLYEMFGEMRVASIEKISNPGTCIGWSLPGSDRRGARGGAIALNPDFPLHREVLSTLRALRRIYPFKVTSDLTKRERALIPSGSGHYRIEKIMESTNRLRILSTLVVLGGRCRITLLECSVPNMRRTVVDIGVDSLINYGIVRKDGPWVSLAEAPWTQTFARLIRAYVRLQSGMKEQIKARCVHSQFSAKHRRVYTFFGSAVVERALMLLAVKGPLTYAELEVAATIRGKPTRLDYHLVQDGIVARRLVHGSSGNYYVVGLNAAHPVYHELRALLCAMAGEKPCLKKQLNDPEATFSVKRLFAGRQFINILLALETAVHSRIDPSTIARMHPQHDVGLLQRRLRQFAKRGIISRLPVGSLVFYQLNPDFPQYRELRALLKRISQVWPFIRPLQASRTRSIPARSRERRTGVSR